MTKFENIYAIEAMTEQEAQEIAEEKHVIKEHNVYLIDLQGYFGFSAIVFKNGHNIRHANDYELHHKGKTHEELKAWYIDTMNHKLYTDAELATVTSYDDYTAKEYYLRNYYCLRYEYISAFNIFHNDEEREAFEKLISDKYYCRVCFAYFDTPEPAQEIEKLFLQLVKANEETSKSREYMKEAFYKELCDHEYCINWQGDYDVFSCFGRVTYGDDKRAEDYMNELKFSQDQKNAFYEARREYSKHAAEYC